uniref:Myb-like domain-containing protein n=1 Tax=Leersia perrieri TaxID=77586 RepID=A0A0D9VNK7_9ORYZ
MQQQQQQQPGSMPPFSAAGTGEAAPSPISSRPPPPQPEQAADEHQLGNGSSSLLEHDGMAGGESAAGGGGNRWPRQETLALLKIRSEMDAAFREAALKGPLWEEVSRKLAEMGYKRNAKKCREKFENVDKYYKRTKDGRAGRGDGKNYRFFTELEALHGAARPHPPPPPQPAPRMSTIPAPIPIIPTPIISAMDAAACVMTMDDVSFSSGSDTEETAEEDGNNNNSHKRKRRHGGGDGKPAMRMFEALMRQVMERQEAMQQRLLEAIERRDQERMIREEAWRRQEIARLARDQDALAHDRAIAASRDAAVISFIQRLTGQSIPTAAAVITPPPPPLQPTPVASAAPPHHHIMPMTPQPQLQPPQSKESTAVAVIPDQAAAQQHETAAAAASSSRWPKAEVHALIQLRTEMEARYQDSGPKGPLWEDISAGMRRMGYSRSSKRCKEKWENINKYFKKVKESNKKRPEDSKTCPYYHQLDALYRSKANANAVAAAGSPSTPAITVLAPVPLSQSTPPPPHGEHGSNGNGINGWPASAAAVGANNGGTQTKASNGNGNGVVMDNNKVILFG